MKKITFIDANKLKELGEPTKENIEKSLFTKEYSVEERKNGKERFLKIMKEAGY